MFYFIMCTLIVKYSVKSCYCCLFYVLAFQDQHTLPKWNILWKAVIVACSMYWPFRTSTPSQSEIFCLKAVIVACSMYWPFRTSTPSQSEIFCLKAVIVACSMYWPFRTSTPSQSEIFCLKALIVDIEPFRNILPFGSEMCWSWKALIATITALRQNISLWEGVLVLKGQYIEQATITALRQNISLWEGVLVLKGQYIEQATITALRQNISLWEGVLVLKEVNCQKDVNWQIIKYLDYGGGSQKK